MDRKPREPRSVTPEQRIYTGLIPTGHRQYMVDAFEGTCTPRQAIRSKCLDCRDHIRDEVRDCNKFLCPLHLYRPYQITEE